MHLLLSEASGFNENQPYDIQQSSGDIVILSHAASELLSAADAMRDLLADSQGQNKFCPSLRLMHLGYLGHPASIDAYLEQTIIGARIVIVRLLGGKSYWDYGCRELYVLCKREKIRLVLLSGDQNWDSELAAFSLAEQDFMQEIFAYFCAGSTVNLKNCLAMMASMLGYQHEYAPPQPVPDFGIFKNWQGKKPEQKICILFYRALIHGGDTKPIDFLCDMLKEEALGGTAFYLSNFKDKAILDGLKENLAEMQPSLIILATGFTLSKSADGMSPEIFADLDVPLLQIVLSSLPYETWLKEQGGLPSKEIAMNIALTEIDGRIFSRAIAFQAPAEIDNLTECPLSRYHIVPDRVRFVAKLAARWVRLRIIPNQEKKLGFILGNYPASDGRLANGVGLDTPEAVLTLLDEAQKAGIYSDNLPQNSKELMRMLSAGVTNQNPRRALSEAILPLKTYHHYLARLPKLLQDEINARWGEAQNDPFIQQDGFHLPFMMFGNVAVGLQIARGYDLDPDEYCHDPALTPPHGYVAFYFWLRESFAADCLVHIGKHGTLEWLPGKSVSLSENCWADAILGAMPVLYPFIANDPGEGTQAKRRTQSVILNHLPPAIQSSGLYGALSTIENLMDEYYEARNLDPKRAAWLGQEILRQSESANLEIGNDDSSRQNGNAEKLSAIENYLCDIKFTMIRSGLHFYGCLPEKYDEMILALLRYKRGEAAHQQSFLQILAEEFALDFDPLQPELLQGECSVPGELSPDGLSSDTKMPQMMSRRQAAEALDSYAINVISGQISLPPNFSRSRAILDDANKTLKPLLNLSAESEKTNFIRGIEGRFIPPGASGAPSRGRADILPTGRNFFSVDLRAVPSIGAWQLGSQSAQLLLQTHLQMHGTPLRTMIISIWGTAQMRTGGEDIAQAMALMGVRPIRDNGRVTGYEILPLNILSRPRVDVTFRISGFFRDAFPNVIMQLAQMIKAVARLDESGEMNPLRAHYLSEKKRHIESGLDSELAELHASQRIFGAQPGTYGAGLQHLIANGNWSSDADFAQIFLSWGGYAYDGDKMQGANMPKLLEMRLKQAQAVVQNQDNREHDILDSDDYYQFSGGLAASVRHFSGEQPEIYHNDHSNPATAKIGTLKQEIARIIRARAANPKWIKSIMKHGYKGAFEIAATVEYLFAFAATAKIVEEHQFDSLFQTYLEDDKVREFMRDYNPQALADMIARFDEAIKRNLWQPRRNSVHDILAELKPK